MYGILYNAKLKPWACLSLKQIPAFVRIIHDWNVELSPHKNVILYPTAVSKWSNNNKIGKSEDAFKDNSTLIPVRISYPLVKGGAKL